MANIPLASTHGSYSMMGQRRKPGVAVNVEHMERIEADLVLSGKASTVGTSELSRSLAYAAARSCSCGGHVCRDA